MQTRPTESWDYEYLYKKDFNTKLMSKEVKTTKK